jgi:hypothetical protein
MPILVAKEPGGGGRKVRRDYKGNCEGRWNFHNLDCTQDLGQMHMSKLIKLNILIMYSLLYVNHVSIRRS